MPLQLFVKGLLLGFGIAAPVGPIGILCIRRTLADGRWHGWVSGLGAASADAVYGAIAAFGLGLVTATLLQWQTGLRLVGGLFLIYLGVRTFLARPAAEVAQARPAGTLLGAYLSTFGLTLSNPATILSFLAVFAGVMPGTPTGGQGEAIVLVLGIFIGSALWWLLLSTLVGGLRRHLSPNVFRWINRIAGAMIAVFGLIAIAGLFA